MHAPLWLVFAATALAGFVVGLVVALFLEGWSIGGAAAGIDDAIHRMHRLLGEAENHRHAQSAGDHE